MDIDVLQNVTISNNIIAKLETNGSAVIRGIEIDNRSASNACGGGTRQCDFAITDVNIVNNSVYNASTQAFSLHPITNPGTMTGAPNLFGNLGNLAAASAIANCSSSASPAAVCSGAATGSVVIAAGTSSVVVNTTAVTAVSQIQVQFDETLGTKLGVTRNSSQASENPAHFVSARAPGTSFTIKTSSAPTVNPACLSYSITN
jgi:hypothetical protein